jgi:heat shock protein HslJ
MKTTGLRALLLALPFALVACAPVLGVVGGPTESVVLPNGEVCGHAGGGATLAFDGQRLAWTCDVGETGPRGLFGAPVVVRETDVSWRLATTARRADGAGFELDRIDTVDARVARLELASGEMCAMAGEGATLAFGGRRVHYTCGGDVVLVGGLTSDDRGLLARRAVLTRRGDVPELGREGVVRVRSVVLEPVDAAAAAEALEATEAAAAATLPAAPAATDAATQPAEVGPAPLLGTVWSLELIRFANGTELVPREPGLYTLLLGPDGSVALRVDCNQGAGRFEVDAERLFFAPFATTRAACPPGTLDQDYLVQLGSAATYQLADDQLVVITTEATQLHFVPLR